MKLLIQLFCLLYSLNSFAYLSDIEAERPGSIEFYDGADLGIGEVSEAVRFTAEMLGNIKRDWTESVAAKQVIAPTVENYILYRDSMLKSLYVAMPIIEWATTNLQNPAERTLASLLLSIVKTLESDLRANTTYIIENPYIDAYMGVNSWTAATTMLSVGKRDQWLSLRNDPLFFEALIVHESTHYYIATYFHHSERYNRCTETEKSAWEVEGFYTKIAMKYFNRKQGYMAAETTRALNFYNMNEESRTDFINKYCSTLPY